MLYITCPTCGYFLGYKTLQWEKESANICNNPKLSEEEIEQQKTTLLMKLELPRYCCRMRMMSYKDIISDIIPIKKEEN